jgi:hypothetical protein
LLNLIEMGSGFNLKQGMSARSEPSVFRPLSVHCTCFSTPSLPSYCIFIHIEPLDGIQTTREAKQRYLQRLCAPAAQSDLRLRGGEHTLAGDVMGICASCLGLNRHPSQDVSLSSSDALATDGLEFVLTHSES